MPEHILFVISILVLCIPSRDTHLEDMLRLKRADDSVRTFLKQTLIPYRRLVANLLFCMHLDLHDGMKFNIVPDITPFAQKI
jgi:hypothetical protein